MSMAKRLLERRRRGQSLRPHIKFDEDINEMGKVRARLLLKFGTSWIHEYWKYFPRIYGQDKLQRSRKPIVHG